jgi:hypothetical protein
MVSFQHDGQKTCFPYVIIVPQGRRVPHFFEERLPEVMHVEDIRLCACPIRLVTKAVYVHIVEPGFNGQPVLRPKTPWAISLSPCFYGPSPKTMNKYQVNQGFGRGMQKTESNSASGTLGAFIVIFVLALLCPCPRKSFLHQGGPRPFWFGFDIACVRELPVRRHCLARGVSYGSSSVD